MGQGLGWGVVYVEAILTGGIGRCPAANIFSPFLGPLGLEPGKLLEQDRMDYLGTNVPLPGRDRQDCPTLGCSMHFSGTALLAGWVG